MQIDPATTTDGVSERRFILDEITGVCWTPPSGAGPRSLVLLAHGGGQHKLAPGVAARARHYVTRYGFAAAAIDAPGHGDRPRTEADERFAADLRERMGRGEAVADQIVAHNTALAATAVTDWRATLDALEQLDEIGPGGPVGFWGLSLGGAIGFTLVAEEPRISAAVLGLVAAVGRIPELAARITVPVQLVAQSEDELVPRESAVALFDALGSADKALHLHPGRHIAVPRFEVEESGLFFARHLGGGG